MKNSKRKSQKPKRRLRNPKKESSYRIIDTAAREAETLEEALERIGIGDDWDYVLVGDGSGSNFSQPCGWGCISIERQTFARECWSGGMSIGTVNIAEMMAYIQPLSVLLAREQQRIKEGQARRILQVHIVTDSEYVKKQGVSGETPRRNGALLRIFDDFTRHGFILHWHWIPRETVELNVLADAISKRARILVKENEVQAYVETTGEMAGRSVYDYNPT